MLKLENCPIEASNIANLGSDLEKKIKEGAAACEKAWDGAGKTGGTLQIWRMEKFQVVEWPSKELGRFYNGDSYIILHTYKRNSGDALGHDVHFWLGANTSQDEAGTAAYKTVELDDRLGGAPVQHREVQGHETDLFLSYFSNNTIELLEGGIESGFNHVEETKYACRLLQVKGTSKAVRVSQVPMSADSLNSGDVFILDNGLDIYQFNGSSSSIFEKMKAGQLVRALRDERHSKPECYMIGEGDEDDASEKFWEILGGKKDIKGADEGGRDAEAAAVAAQEKKLFRLSDQSSSTLSFDLVSSGELNKSDLDSKDVFIVDVGAEVYVWIGAQSSVAERKHGLQYAQQYIKDNGKDLYTPISRVVEGGENAVFNSLFGCGSRDLNFDEGFPHSCCPHLPSDNPKWNFLQEESSVAATSSLFSAMNINKSACKTSKIEKNDEVEKAVGQVFGFFANKISSHFF